MALLHEDARQAQSASPVKLCTAAYHSRHSPEDESTARSDRSTAPTKWPFGGKANSHDAVEFFASMRRISGQTAHTEPTLLLWGRF